jgi:acryloyl-coenzyme A reductase
MRAAILERFGGPDSFIIGEMPRPAPGFDQLLVKVAACGVCGHDLLNRAGHFPHAKLPLVPGHEIAGTVVEAGLSVKRFKAGDRVALIQRIPCGLCALCRSGRENICVSGPGFYGEEISGGYGDYVIASERNAVAVPQNIPLTIAAVLSCAIGTGFHALRRATLGLGDRVLITGASGGVGIHTIKLAKLMGLNTIAVSSTEDKREKLVAAGVDEVVVAPDHQFHKQVREITAGAGVDAIIEIAGSPTFASSMRSVKAGGRVVLVGNVEPGNVGLNPAMSILKEINLIGSGHATLADLQQVVDLVATGRIQPEIAAYLPRDRIGDAHRMMEQRKTSGRVVLVHDEQ